MKNKKQMLAAILLTGSALLSNSAFATTDPTLINQSSKQEESVSSEAPKEKKVEQLNTSKEEKKVSSKDEVLPKEQNPQEKNEKTTKVWMNNQPEMSYEQLIKNIDDHNVKKIVYSESPYEFGSVKLELNNGDKFIAPVITRINFENIANKNKDIAIQVVKSYTELNQKQIEEDKNISSAEKFYKYSKYYTGEFLDSFFGFVLSIGRMVLIFGIIYYILFALASKGKSGSAKKVAAKDIDISFDDIAGNDSAKRDIKEAISFFKDNAKFKKFGLDMPSGILLNGPPGNGKTMLAKAVAKECGADFYSATGSEFEEMFAGLGAKRVRTLFANARKSKKAVIFIDEIDSVAKKRGGINDYHEQTLNQLLTEMDGLTSKHKDCQILVIAATNRIDVLDEAILRPGRFDKKLFIMKPSKKDRIAIMKRYIDKAVEKSNGELIVGEDLDWDSMGSLSSGMSGAEVKNLIDESLTIMIREDQHCLNQDIFRKAKNKVLLGSPRKDLDLIEKDRKTVSYHELGHAFASYVTSKQKRTVEGVTIVPHEKALGVTFQVENHDAVLRTKEEFLDDLTVLLAGRAAEEVFMKCITNGASNDLERANAIAYEMFAVYGMNEKMPLLNVSQYANNLSEHTKSKIEEEISNLLFKRYEEIKASIRQHKEFFEYGVSVLMAQEYIDKDGFKEMAEKYELNKVDLA